MTPSQLKRNVEREWPDCKYFTPKNMRFAGDAMSNYGVRTATIVTNWSEDDRYIPDLRRSVECWELYRKKPVKYGLNNSAFFSKDNFRLMKGFLSII